MPWFSFILLLFALDTFANYACRNRQGQKVDWFVVYKLPQGGGKKGTGREYLYLDSQNVNWSEGEDIGDVKSPVGATIQQVYESAKDDFYYMYNDDHPSGKSDSYRGHSKGVTAFGNDHGFWMVHSIPKFPPLKQYSYPETGRKYGQTILCISIPTDSVNIVADYLMFVQSTPYDHNLPQRFATRFPTLQNVIKKQSLARSATVFQISKELKTVNGHQLRTYAKHKKFDGDIWNDIISREIGVTMAVESWLNGGADDLHTTCTKNSAVHDVQEIRIQGNDFKSSKDHSKWGVSNTRNNPIVCIGDMNRQKSQLKRGGGAICLRHEALWNLFYNSVVKVEPCKGQSNYSFETVAIISLAIMIM